MHQYTGKTELNYSCKGQYIYNTFTTITQYHKYDIRCTK